MKMPTSLERRITRFGGVCVDDWQKCHYIVCSEAQKLDIRRISTAMGQVYEEGQKLALFVKEGFVAASIAAGVIVDDAAYRV